MLTAKVGHDNLQQRLGCDLITTKETSVKIHKGKKKRFQLVFLDLPEFIFKGSTFLRADVSLAVSKVMGVATNRKVDDSTSKHTLNSDGSMKSCKPG